MNLYRQTAKEGTYMKSNGDVSSSFLTRGIVEKCKGCDVAVYSGGTVHVMNTIRWLTLFTSLRYHKQKHNTLLGLRNICGQAPRWLVRLGLLRLLSVTYEYEYIDIVIPSVKTKTR